MKSKKIMYIIILFLIVLIGCLLLYKKVFKIEPSSKPNQPNQIVNNDKEDFDFKVIKETNNLVKDQNYLISPLSMGFALSLLKEGADGSTKSQINNMLNNYKLPKILNVKDRIGIANLLFIKSKYKNDINKDYISLLQNKYQSDLMFDDFVTPNKVNEWISEKTYKMIPDAIDKLNEEFVLGVANTIAIDVEWKNKFECTRTHEEDFTKIDNQKMKTAMMHGSDDVYYIENNNAKGIIKDYKIYDTKTQKEVYEENENTVALEYIAILPNNNVNKYLKSFDRDELNDLLKNKRSANYKLEINYSLPKYTYDYTYEDFQKMLNNLGMIDAFDPNNANFKNMVNKNSDLQLYVSKSIHKTHIELSENGTKAAAVTIFILDKNTAIINEKERINIEFNKPFIYIIKEKNSDNIWFFGTVYEPIKWEDNTNNCNFR